MDKFQWILNQNTTFIQGNCDGPHFVSAPKYWPSRVLNVVTCWDWYPTNTGSVILVRALCCSRCRVMIDFISITKGTQCACLRQQIFEWTTDCMFHYGVISWKSFPLYWTVSPLSYLYTGNLISGMTADWELDTIEYRYNNVQHNSTLQRALQFLRGNILHLVQWNFDRNSYIFIQQNAFENVIWKLWRRPFCLGLNVLTQRMLGIGYFAAPISNVGQCIIYLRLDTFWRFSYAFVTKSELRT